jgi:pyruvate formate lyase activating enzyme
VCAEACPHGGLRAIGREVTVEEVVSEVERDRSFYRRSGGGVTLSGGEPLAQPYFTAALLREFHRRNIHTAVETCGHAPWASLEMCVGEIDCVLLDIKHLDDEMHKRLVGLSNRMILQNARALSRIGMQIIVRLPLIPGITTDLEHIGAVAQLAREIGAIEVHLMPFHQLGKQKYRRLSLPYDLEDRRPLSESREGMLFLQTAQGLLAGMGVRAVVGG